MGIIYKHTSPIGKSYIGQTKYNLAKRTMEHIYDARHAAKKDFKITTGCVAFWQALIKYGIENFETKILIECKNEDLDKYEVEMIKLHNTMSPHGYNLTSGGNTNKTISLETRGKISRTTQQAMITLGTKLKRSDASAGCSLYIGFYKYRKRMGFRIQAHPKCSYKEFDILEYKTLDICKQAAEEYKSKLDSNEIEHTKIQKKGNNIPSGITQVGNGFRVQFFVNRKKFVKCFYRKDRTIGENYKLALEYRNSAVEQQTTKIKSDEIVDYKSDSSDDFDDIYNIEDNTFYPSEVDILDDTCIISYRRILPNNKK